MVRPRSVRKATACCTPASADGLCFLRELFLEAGLAGFAWPGGRLPLGGSALPEGAAACCAAPPLEEPGLTGVLGVGVASGLGPAFTGGVGG